MHQSRMSRASMPTTSISVLGRSTEAAGTSECRVHFGAAGTGACSRLAKTVSGHEGRLLRLPAGKSGWGLPAPLRRGGSRKDFGPDGSRPLGEEKKTCETVQLDRGSSESRHREQPSPTPELFGVKEQGKDGTDWLPGTDLFGGRERAAGSPPQSAILGWRRAATRLPGESGFFGRRTTPGVDGPSLLAAQGQFSREPTCPLPREQALHRQVFCSSERDGESQV